jgi:hypothetical protein
MEIALDQSLKTYSGGLGFLAGSHMLSAGYLQMPMVGVTMLWSYGYYDQRIDHSGQVDVAYIRKYYDFLTDINVTVEVDVFGEKVKVRISAIIRVNLGLLSNFLLKIFSKSLSISTQITFFPAAKRSSVNAPSPGPISKTVSVSETLATSIILSNTSF